MLFRSVLIGIGCFVVGLGYWIFSRDRIFFIMSSTLLLFSLFRGYSLYSTISKQRYDIIEGTCIGVSSKPFRKYFSIKITDNTGVESTLKLGKQTKIKIGVRYRFFFSRDNRAFLGNEYFDTALSFDCFLGFEELGKSE